MYIERYRYSTVNIYMDLSAACLHDNLIQYGFKYTLLQHCIVGELEFTNSLRVTKLNMSLKMDSYTDQTARRSV